MLQINNKLTVFEIDLQTI